MSAGVRKNFIFDPMVAQHLEALAASHGKSLNKTVQELIEERYREIEKEAKLKILHELAGSATGLFGNMSIQEIKANMDV